MSWLSANAGLAGTILGMVGAGSAAVWKWWTGRKGQRISEIVQIQEVSKNALARSQAELEASEKKRKRDKEMYTDRIRRLEKVVAGPIAELVKWHDAGATPPPPEITDEIRGLIAVLTYWGSEE